MATPNLVRAFLIGAVAIAAIWAPPASADSGPDCARSARCADPSPANSTTGPSTSTGPNWDVPTGWSNETQFTRPDYNPFGAGPHPPLVALD